MGKPRDKAERFLRHLAPLEGALEAYCRRSVSDSAAVEDVLQSAVANAYRDFHLYAEGTNFRAWIFRYLNLEIYAGNRRHWRDRHESLPNEQVAEDVWGLAVEEPLVEQLLEQPDRVLEHCDEALSEAIRRLDPFGRSVLLLRSIGQFKHREMAEVLEAPVGTVMSALSRARAELRRRLANYPRGQGWIEPESTREMIDD